VSCRHHIEAESSVLAGHDEQGGGGVQQIEQNLSGVAARMLDVHSWLVYGRVL